MATPNHATTTSLSSGTGQRLYQKARKLIPGGTHLFGKRQENFAPGQWPTYYAEARGCEVVDLDGRTYIDMSMGGIGACVLGYADPDVTAAAADALKKGVMCTLNPPKEIELVELLLEIHPWADQVRLGRMGGETVAIAVRIVRAATGRHKLAFCGYHGWHDWYLAANLPAQPDGAAQDVLGQGHLLPGLDPAGVAPGLSGTMLPFRYNQIEQLEAIVAEHGKDLAAVIMEPMAATPPEPGFLERVRELAHGCGARLVFDEITIGWKLCLGGAHLKFGIEPDVAVYAKSTGNGHPIAAVVGKADTMEAAQDTFISSTMWTEAIGPAAAVATIEKMKRIDLPAHIDRIGRLTCEGLGPLAKKHNVPLKFNGPPALTVYAFDHPRAAALQTLWTVRMLERGYLVSGVFFSMLAHESHHVEAFVEACDPVFAEMGQAIRDGDIERRIGGPVKHTGFRRLT
jgi:glutamate-1-semialdehyde 2,1-aminomutase